MRPAHTGRMSKFIGKSEVSDERIQLPTNAGGAA